MIANPNGIRTESGATPLASIDTRYATPRQAILRPKVGIHRLGSDALEAATMDGAPRFDGGV